MRLRACTVALTLGSVLVLTGITAVIAYADPPGCSVNTPTFSGEGGLLKARVTATCETSETRTLRLEIKQENRLSDALTAANSQQDTNTQYSVETATCDGGRTDTYYARAFFVGTTTYHDSAHIRVSTCG